MAKLHCMLRLAVNCVFFLPWMKFERNAVLSFACLSASTLEYYRICRVLLRKMILTIII